MVSVQATGSAEEESHQVQSAEHQGVSAAPITFRILREFPAYPDEMSWRKLLTEVELPSHYTAPTFFREPYFEGKRPFAILAMAGQPVVGVLTGFHDGRVVTCGLPTRPQIQIHPAADLSAVICAFVQGLKEESRGADLVSIFTWEWLLIDAIEEYGYRRKVLEGNPVLDLRMGTDSLFKKCDLKRSNIRQAIRYGVEVSPAETREDYEAFYKIYADWCASKNTICHPYEIEEQAFRATATNRRLFVARHNGKIIAGSVFRFFPGGLIEYSRNSSLPESRSLRPNDLLIWRGIEWACKEGFSLFSMGGSHRFLRGFGGSMVPILRYRLDRTLFRRVDRSEQLIDAGRNYVSKLPPVWEKRVRRMIGRDQPLGW